MAIAHEYLTTGAHGHWTGFRPLFGGSRGRLPHRDWIANVFIPRRLSALSRCEVALETLRESKRTPSKRTTKRRIVFVLVEQSGVLATLSRWRSWVRIPSGTLENQGSGVRKKPAYDVWLAPDSGLLTPRKRHGTQTGKAAKLKPW